ncbi:MAG TPA: LLM class flavin-dependent oxidoreductase [Pseudonocardiaceae bacterium]|nr:LLM class flavin-dependent oxidoreductase [Pseudonocardiaceae bacterium]
MRLGVSWVVGDIRRYPELVERSENVGFEVIGVPDTQAPAYRNVYVAMTLAVRATRAATVMSMVTNPQTRHPGVTANAMSTLAELSGGRVACGIGTGDSAVAGLGLPPATRRELTDYVTELRDRWRELPTPPPVLLAAEGPKLAALAGAIGDGALLAGDLSAGRIAWYRDHIRTGAGHDLPADYPMWGLLRTSIDDDPDRALHRAAPAIAAAANHAYRAGFANTSLDADTQERIGRLRAGYRVVAHNDFAADRKDGNANAGLLRELHLTRPLADRFALVGTPTQVADRLRALELAGLHHVIIRPVTTEPLGFLDRWQAVAAELTHPNPVAPPP